MFDKHMPPAILKRRISREIWESYWKFAFVRNPWDWIVSRHFHGRQGGSEARPADAKITPDDILRLCRKRRLLRGITWSSYRTQYAFLSDASGALQVDFVGKFENLQEDFCTIGRKVGLPPEKLMLTKSNETVHKHYSCYYDEGTKQLVQRLFARDIQAFEYQYEDVTAGQNRPSGLPVHRP